MQSLEVEDKWSAGRREREVTGKGEILLAPTAEEEGKRRWKGVAVVLANTKEPLPSRFPSAPLLSSPNQYTSCFYPWLLWCLCWWTSLCVLRCRLAGTRARTHTHSTTRSLHPPAHCCPVLPCSRGNN